MNTNQERHGGQPDPVRARRYAELRHAGQVYAAEAPYSVHLENVVAVLARFGITNPVMVCAAWLHDTIEDTGTSYNDIRGRFGHDVAELVYAVTSELGRNRKERNAKTYPKIVEAGHDAIQLKLADRIANVEYGLATSGKADMYAKEFKDFEAVLRYDGVCDCQGRGNEHRQLRHLALEPMWQYLERLLSGI